MLCWAHNLSIYEHFENLCMDVYSNMTIMCIHVFVCKIIINKNFVCVLFQAEYVIKKQVYLRWFCRLERRYLSSMMQ